MHAGERDEREARREACPYEPDLAETRVEDSPEDVPAERVTDAEASSVGSLEDDSHERRRREHAGEHTEDEAQSRLHWRLDPAEDGEERDRAADAGEEQREAQEARDGEADTDFSRDFVVLQQLVDDAGRVALRLDGEDERAVERVRVGRDDPPGNRVRAAGERASSSSIATVCASGREVRPESTRSASES